MQRWHRASAIQSARDSLAAKNEPLLAKVEPLAYATRPPNGGAAVEAEQDRMSKARRDLMDVVKQVRENDDAAAKAVVAQLGPDQQKQAEEMLKKQHGDADKAIRKGMGRH